MAAPYVPEQSTFLSCIPRTAGLDPTKLNLNGLQGKGALPDGLGKGFTHYVNAMTQSPPPVPDAQVTLAMVILLMRR